MRIWICLVVGYGGEEEVADHHYGDGEEDPVARLLMLAGGTMSVSQ